LKRPLDACNRPDANNLTSLVSSRTGSRDGRPDHKSQAGGGEQPKRRAEREPLLLERGHVASGAGFAGRIRSG